MDESNLKIGMGWDGEEELDLILTATRSFNSPKKWLQLPLVQLICQ